MNTNGRLPWQHIPLCSLSWLNGHGFCWNCELWPHHLPLQTGLKQQVKNKTYTHQQLLHLQPKTSSKQMVATQLIIQWLLQNLFHLTCFSAPLLFCLLGDVEFALVGDVICGLTVEYRDGLTTLLVVEGPHLHVPPTEEDLFKSGHLDGNWTHKWLIHKFPHTNHQKSGLTATLCCLDSSTGSCGGCGSILVL